MRPELLETWKWENGTLKKDVSVKLPGLLYTMILPDGKYLACKDPGNAYVAWPLTLGSLGSKDIIKKWDPPAHWVY